MSKLRKQLLFDKSLERIRFLFDITGIKLETEKRNIKQNCIYLFNFLCLTSDILFAIPWIIISIAKAKNLIEITFVAPCLTLSILGDIKSVFLVMNEAEVFKLILELRTLERKKNEFQIIDEDDVIKPEIKRLNFITKTLNILNCLMIFVFDVSPLIIIAVRYYKTGELKLMLPFEDIYPFDALDLRYWPLFYVYQIWSECVVLFEMCAADFLFFTCCIHIKIQFMLLKRQFEKIIPANSLSVLDADSAEIQKKLFSLIKWHELIISSANSLEVVYSKSTLLNILSSSLVICLTGFNVTVIGEFAYVVTSLTFLFLGLLQIYFLCYFGDDLTRSSMAISDAVYNSRWYMSNIRTGRNLLIVQTRAQHPCKLTGAGFMDVNLQTFMTILSTSWSYFALLQTIYSSR